MHYLLRSTLLTLFLISFIVNPIDNVHFYRPSFFWGEPRLECPWLTTVNNYIGYGKTHSGFNSEGKKTDVLNIYGPQNMRNLADNVANLNPLNPFDALILDLNNVTTSDTFGMVALKGKFTLVENVVDIYQNICKGFFLQLYIPARKFDINPELTAENLRNRDLTPAHEKTVEWQAFVNNFFPIMKKNNISLRTIRRAGLGDISLLAGWACTSLDTTCLDFVDVAAKIGVLFPTGKTRNPDDIFDIPQGYNGHWGAPLKFDVSVGLFEWLTCGLHLGSLYLASKKEQIRIHTSEKQQGFIKLTKTDAHVDPGIYFDFDVFTKIDHFCKGLSMFFIYAYNFKEQDSLELNNGLTVNPTVFNNDPLFASWSQHALNVILEYDFAKKISDIGVKLAFSYNHVLGGKRILSTDMQGGYVGIDVICTF